MEEKSNGATATSDGVNKSASIRAYLKEHPRAKPVKVVAALQEKGIEVNDSLVRSVRSDTKRAKKRDRSKAGKKGKKFAGNKKATEPRGTRPYPQRPLEEALLIPEAIRRDNNGHPWPPEEVAKAAMSLTKGAAKFFYAAAASRDYGLTVGSRDTDKIELTDLGRSIFFDGDEATARQKKIEAFFSVDIFKRVYDHYGGSRLPAKEFLGNTLLSEFSLKSEFHEEFANIFKANCKFLQIEDSLDGVVTITKKTVEAEHADIRVVGKAKGKFDRTAFVIMPFTEKHVAEKPEGFFNEVLSVLISPAANEAGFSVESAERPGSDIIQSTIVTQLIEADLVIVDLTDHNPNVLFELGIRIAKDLPVALIKAKGTDRIFDVDHMMRVETYDPNLWPSTLKDDLPKIKDHVKAAWDNRDTNPSYMKILLGKKN